MLTTRKRLYLVHKEITNLAQNTAAPVIMHPDIPRNIQLARFPLGQRRALFNVRVVDSECLVKIVCIDSIAIEFLAVQFSLFQKLFLEIFGYIRKNVKLRIPCAVPKVKPDEPANFRF